MAATVRAFSIAYLAALAAIIAIAWAASAFFGFELPGSAMGVVPFVVGVQFAAQAYAKRQGDAPSGGYAWVRREARARVICEGCVEVMRCREFARDNRELGFWGAESEAERASAGFAPTTPIIGRRQVAERRATARSNY